LSNKVSVEAKELFDKYPEIIKNHLSELFESILDNLYLDNIVSILFIGSGSRNELSYNIQEKDIDIFSDYEFVIIVNKMLSQKEFDKLNKIFRSLEEKWDIKSPLFYIDYGVSTLSKFKLTPPTLWAYEAKNLGVIVYGRDVRQDLVDVVLSNLDYGNLNELIIVRLWNMLVHMNNVFIKKENNKYEDFIIKFYYSRNILDILTILLPNYSILKAGYRNRTKYFVEKFNNQKWNSYKKDFERITNLKIDLVDDISLEESQNIFNDGFINLIADISSLNNVKSIEDLEKNRNIIIKNKIFKEKTIRTLRRKVIELKLFKNYYRYDLKSIELFMNDEIRMNLLFLLLLIHKSMHLSLPNDEKIKYLKKAIDYFNKISYQNKYNYSYDISFEDNFISLREKLLDFMMIWFYGRSNVQKKDIEKHMKWRDK